jgi:hypothetical protein
MTTETIALVRELTAFLESGICSAAEFYRLLDDDPVLFSLQVDGNPADGTGYFVSGMEATERLKSFVAALRIRAAETQQNARSTMRLSDINRDHAIS